MTRRSTRVRARIPVLITSLDPSIPFSSVCETLIVNAHGCAVQVPRPLEIGTPMRLRVSPPQQTKAGLAVDPGVGEGREVTGRIMVCQPIGGNQALWLAAIELDKPGNIWGLTPFPEDWARFDADAAESEASEPPTGRPIPGLKMPVWPLAAPSARTGLPARAGDGELKKQLAVQQETIARLKDELATALASVPGMVRKHLAEAQQDVLAQARKQLSAMLADSVQGQFTAQSDAIAGLQERMTSLGSVPDQVRKQLAEAQQDVLAQLSAMLADSVQGQFTAQSDAIARLQERMTSLGSIPDQVRKQLAEAQQDVLAQLSAMLADSVQGQFTAQSDAIARLQERLTSLESLPGQVRKQLAEAQQAEVREQLGAALAELVMPLQEELAVCRKKAEDAQQIRAAVAEQLEQLPWHIEQHAQAAFQRLQERARAELQGIIAETRARAEPEAAQRQALQGSAEALQKELAQARASLESSMRSLPERIHEPIAVAVEDALAQARAELSADLTRELEARDERGTTLADELRAAADLLRREREATSAQVVEIDAKREELRLWLAEEQATYMKQVSRRLEQLTERQAADTNEVRQKLEQLAGELAARSVRALEEKIRSEVEIQAKRAETDLNQRFGPTLDRAADLRQEALSLLNTLQRESERCESQVRALLEEKNGVEAWIAERTADFRKLFHDALVETTGQIRGRLQMAVEMIEQPVATLRDQAVQQLQEQASRQARQLRESGDEATERLRGLRRDIESAVRESLRMQAAETSAAFGREIAEVAQRSVEEWRSTLARNLESIASLLGQQLPGGQK
jgi:cation transport regulator ChaB